MKKRQLKKQIQGLCGGLAVDCAIIASDTDEAKAAEIVTKAAKAQAKAVSHLGVSFDKTEKDFPNAAAYRKARTAYYRTAYNALAKELNDDLTAVVHALNELQKNQAKA